MADLVRRSYGSRRRPREARDGTTSEFLAFRLATEPYAAPVTVIREILKPPPVTQVPRAPDTILGIVSVRGQLVTVFDLRRKLSLPAVPVTRKSRILLVETQDETIGLFVDEVLQVHRLLESEIELAAPALGGEVAEYITGVARPHSDPTQGIIVLLDLHAVLG